MVDTPDNFSNASIAHYYGPELKRYIHLRAIGKTSLAALTGAFGSEYSGAMDPWAYVYLIETSDAYLHGLAVAVAGMSDEQLWNEGVAVRVLFSIATDETAKRAERIAAAKELNVLFGITIVDEKGNTRKTGMTFEELMRMTPSAKNGAAESKVH